MFRAINNLSLMLVSLGVLALLSCSAGTAATVTVTPSTATPLVGSNFTVTISGSDFTPDADPNLDQTTAGATLGLVLTGGISYVNPSPDNNAALPATGPFAEVNGGGYFPHPASGLPTTFDILATPGVGASGSFIALVLTFHADSAGPATIALIDHHDGFLAWYQKNDPFDPIPVTYNQGSLTVVTPVPAAVWLLGSALGMLGWVRRKSIS